MRGFILVGLVLLSLAATGHADRYAMPISLEDNTDVSTNADHKFLRTLLAEDKQNQRQLANVVQPPTESPAELEQEELQEESNVGHLILYLFLLLGTFVALAIVCDDYLAPALETLSEAWQIPHDVACASFLAFGSSAPEICINCIATARGKVDVSMGAIMGSGILAYTVIPAVCVLVSKGQMLHLELVPLLRDVLSYLVALILFVVFVLNGSLGLREDIVLVSLFVVYIGLQFFLGQFYHDPREDLEKPKEVMNESASQRLAPEIEPMKDYGSSSTADKGRRRSLSDESEMDRESPAECLSIIGCTTRILKMFTIPIEAVLSVTLPPLCTGDDEIDVTKTWPQTLVVSLVYVALLSWAVLELTTSIADIVGMPHHIAGLTIVAVGAQVEDLFASVAVAKIGQGPSAISNAVGSQVINIFLGIGFPFLVFNIYTGNDIYMKQGKVGGSVLLSGMILMSLVLVFLFLCFRTCTIHRIKEARTGHRSGHSGLDEDRKPSLSMFDAVVLMLLYAVNLGVIIAHGLGFINFEL